MTLEKKAIGVAFNEPIVSGHAFSEASRDVLVQVEAIEEALRDLGHRGVRMPFTKDLDNFLRAIREQGVSMVLNLCETVDEDPRLSGHPAALLELVGIPLSGSPSMALMVTTDKLTTKRILQACNICTPRYTVCDGLGGFDASGLRYPVIVKPRYEDASIGIDQESIFQNEGQLTRGVSRLSEQFGTVLIEEFIEGREFNVSLLGYPTVRPLPVAEIDFSDFPKHLYPIVGYRAKWNKGSFEYHHTPRKFPGDLPGAIVEEITITAAKCFHVFMLRDYGRIDMRLDAQGRLYVLEVNANPCLSPDAGFAAATAKAGMYYTQVVAALISFMIQRLE